jgi:hypothetical protein
MGRGWSRRQDVRDVARSQVTVVETQATIGENSLKSENRKRQTEREQEQPGMHRVRHVTQPNTLVSVGPWPEGGGLKG